MHSSIVLKYIYALFIGILLATFVGVGIAAFYEAPKYPDYPIQLQTPAEKNLSSSDSAEIRRLEIEQEQKQKTYQQQSETYNRNVSIVSLVFAVIIVIVSIILANTLAVIADGLLVGGVLTLLYSVGRGFATPDNKFRFVVVSVGLLIALVLGYIKFVKPAAKKK